MGRGIESLDKAYSIFFTAALIVLAVLVVLCLIRAIIGPRVTDRIVSVNMTGTMVIVMIGILALMLGEGYLVDICIIYAMISFLAVIVLVKVYMGIYLAGKREQDSKDTAKASKEKAASDPAVEKMSVPAGKQVWEESK